MPKLTAVFLSGLLSIAAHGQTASTPYTWAPITPALTAPRADACAATAPDGSAIVSGGIGGESKALSSAERYRQDGGFSPAPALNNARSAHTCTTLQDGRILVAGGTDGQGNPIGTAELYDPSSDSWEIVANLNDPRWGHSATLLNDGRVLVAGGQDFYGAKDTIEIFDPLQLAFLPLSATLSSPRMNFATALTLDGLVAILGGTDGFTPLASVDIFNPEQNRIIAGSPLLTPRMDLSANTLPDGTILAAGGFDGQQDLSSAEIYDVAKGSTPALGRLGTARRGHRGITLPGNGNVLLLGGTGDSAVLAGSELYNFPDGGFSTVGALSTPRARTAITPVGDGLILSAGGVSTDRVTPVPNCGLFTPPSFSWSLDVLAQSLSVQGFGFRPGNVNLQFTQPVVSNAGTVSTTTGNFTAPANPVPLLNGGSANWTMTASQTTPAPLQATFTRRVVFADVVLAASCNPCDFGQSLLLSATVFNLQQSRFPAKPAGGDRVTFFDGRTALNSGVLSDTSPVATRSQNLLPGIHPLSAAIFGNTDGFIGVSRTLAVTIKPAPTSISVAVGPDPVVTGNSVGISPRLAFDTSLPARIGAAPTGTITLRVGATTRTAAIGQALVIAAPPIGSYLVTAEYGGDKNYAASVSPPVVLSVTSANPPQLSIPFIGVVGQGNSWSLRNQLSSGPADTQFLFGEGTVRTLPVVGDWTSSGHSGIGSFNPATGAWTLSNSRASSQAETRFTFGAPNAGLIPVTGDWDGNGTTTAGLFNPATAEWTLINLNSDAGIATATRFVFGTPGAGQIPVTGDWDGNGTTTIGVFNPGSGVWQVRNSNSVGPADAQFLFSAGAGVPVVPITGNWTGTRRTGIGVFAPQSGIWRLRRTPDGGSPDFAFSFGGSTAGSGTTPVAGNQ